MSSAREVINLDLGGDFGFRPTAREILEAAHPTRRGDRPPTVADLTGFRLAQTYLSREAAIQLSFPGFSGSTSLNSFGLVYEALAATDSVRKNDEGIIYEEVYAIGLIVKVSVKNVTVKGAVDMAFVAAATELKKADSFYEIDVLPSDPRLTSKLVSDRGSLDAGGYRSVLDSLGLVLAEIKKIGRELEPQRHTRMIRSASEFGRELELTKAYVFGVRWLHKRRTLDEALVEARERGLNETLVDMAYRDFWPDVQPREDPPHFVRQDAGKWLTVAN